MADKRISQLVERTDIANNDVVPIVASGASTTNKATISSIQTYMQENLDVGVTSVGVYAPARRRRVATRSRSLGKGVNKRERERAIKTMSTFPRMY
jgi:hypothetical protein